MTERQKMLIKQMYEEMIDEEKSSNKREQVCNICGKEFDKWDKQEKFGFHYKIGYGSNYDLIKIDLNMCCGCFDKLLDYILPQCKIDPLTDIPFVKF